MSLHNDPNWLRAGNWFEQKNSEDKYFDISLIGVGASKSAITPNAAHTTPNAIRQALLRYSTYNANHDVELTKLIAGDLGDVSDPDNQEKTHKELTSLYKKSKTVILLGGDNSITYSGVRALDKNVGVITLDAHHDIRDGISNGSPIRQLIEWGIAGKNIVQIGISDFANSKIYGDRAKEFGINVIHRSNIENASARALSALQDCDQIYLDIDMDVCDRSVVPAAPASIPGGITANELRHLVFEIAKSPKVNHFDITEVDASIDTPDQRTVRLAALCVLEIASAKVVLKL
jgi:formiminoglutamase